MLDDFEGEAQRRRDGGFEGVIWKKQTAEYVYHLYQPTGGPVNRIELLTRKLKKRVELTAGDFRGSLPSTVHMRGKYTLSIHLTRL